MSDFRKLFKEKGIKLTRQREELIKLLQKIPHPITAEDMFLMIKDKYQGICLATIYRNLDLFVNKKIVRQLQLSGTKREYDLIGKEHYHYLICLGCNKTIKLKNCPIKEYEEKVTAETSFTIVDHNFSLYGYCPECQESKIES